MERYLLALLVASQFEKDRKKALDLALGLWTWAHQQSDECTDDDRQASAARAHKSKLP